MVDVRIEEPDDGFSGSVTHNRGKNFRWTGLISVLVIPYTDTVNIVLIPSEITKESDLMLNSFGYYEPKNISPVDPEEIDLVIVPGVVFDKSFNRIGFGKGYYDRILSKLKPSAKKVAIAHDFQVLQSIPTEDHDIKMDMIITEETIWDSGDVS